jgi:hypothetical protein
MTTATIASAIIHFNNCSPLQNQLQNKKFSAAAASYRDALRMIALAPKVIIMWPMR